MRRIVEIIVSVFISVFSITAVLSAIVISYLIGFKQGYAVSEGVYQTTFVDWINRLNKMRSEPTVVYQPTSLPQTEVEAPRSVSWGGPELWEAVNKARVENGVNPLKQADELCTITSIRLNELLELGKLDGHEGFSNLAERRTDLKWIFEKYNLAEFLASGGETPQETIDLWMNTLAHKKLLTGGEYSFGCIYAQESFAVAIAAY